jgi:hypothetical protein
MARAEETVVLGAGELVAFVVAPDVIRGWA